MTDDAKWAATPSIVAAGHHLMETSIDDDLERLGSFRSLREACRLSA